MKKSVGKPPSKKLAPAKASTAVVNEADPRFEPVAKALARTAGFSLMESKSRATRGMMLHGKSFGMSTGGRYIVKLNDARAAALIAEGIGKSFSPAAGKILKGWLEVTSPNANWVALAKEALKLASAARTKPAAKTKR